MLVPTQEEELAEGSTMPYASQNTQTIIQPSTFKPQKKQKHRKSKNKDTQETQPSGPTNEALNEENVPAQVIDLENTKTVQAQEISSLKKRVKRLEKKKRSRTHGLKRLYMIGLSARVESSAKEQSLGEEDASKQERNIADIDVDAETTFGDETAKDQGRYDDQEMFDTSVLDYEEEVLLKEAQDVQNVVKKVIEDITTARIEEIANTTTIITDVDVTPDELTMAQSLVEIKKSKPKGETTTTTTVTIPTPDSTSPKARRVVMQEPIETPTTTTIPKYSKVQDKGKGITVEEPLKMKKKDQISFDEQEARRLQTELDEQDKLAEAKDQLIEDENLAWDNKNREENHQPKLKRGIKCDKLDQERSKKQKVEDDKESEELKRCLEIIPDDGDDVTIDAIPLSITTSIIDYKIYKEGKKSYFQIFRADENSQMYYTFCKMLKNFDREDLKVLWRLVKYKFEKGQPLDDMDCYLLHTLKTMFEHHVEDTIWKSQQGLTKINLGLVPNQVASTLAKPLSKKDLDLLFQPMFDEYFKPSLSAVSPTISDATLPQVTAGASSSTTIDQDVPSPRTTPKSETTITPIQPSNVEDYNRENKDAEFGSDTFTNPFAPPETSFAESSSRIVDSTNIHTFNQPLSYNIKCTRDHILYRFNFKKIPIYCDSKSTIPLSCNTIQHSRTKHIVVRYHFIKEQVENEVVELYFVKTTYQLVDVFTKALGRERFKFLLNHLGMQSITPRKLKSLAELDEE
nr:retrotransposon protein, putative, unclassified [Tanacetum cinerariifolium]